MSFLYVVLPACRIFENIGVKSGLIGCIHSMKIGRYSVNLLGFEDGDLVTHSEGVTECQKSCTNGTCGCSGKLPCGLSRRLIMLFVEKLIENRIRPIGAGCYDDMACSSEPCSFGSTCESLPGGRYACFCLPGLTGTDCDKCKNEILK